LKLRNWEINEALRSGDVLGAVNIVADEFGIQRFAHDSDAVKSMNVHSHGSPARQQIRITLDGVLYFWESGRFYKGLSGARGQWIVVWSAN
jgi:hypothetical protein